MNAPNINKRRWPGSLLLAGLTVIVLIALIATRPPPRGGYSQSHERFSATRPLVDQHQLQTVHALAALASTPEEFAFVRDAFRLADADLDLAFAIALREAESHLVALSAEAFALQVRISHAELMVQQDSARVSLLEKQLAGLGAHANDMLHQELDLAKAQLALSQDELNDAREDFQRAGGDPASRIQRQLQQHQLAQHDAESAPPLAADKKSSSNYGTSNLVAQAIAWNDLRGKLSPLEVARNELFSTSAALAQVHDVVARRAEETSAKLTERRSRRNSGPSANASTLAKTEILMFVKQQSDDERTLAELSKRIDGERELADVYGKWYQFVSSHGRSELHGVFASFLWILIVVQVIRYSEPVSERLLRRVVPDDSKRVAYRTAVRFASQALGILVIIMVIFGIPNELPSAILGIVGAGLAVVLKDFSVSFFDSRIRGVVAAYSQPASPSK
jgi:hypothetical protein